MQILPLGGIRHIYQVNFRRIMQDDRDEAHRASVLKGREYHCTFTYKLLKQITTKLKFIFQKQIILYFVFRYEIN